MLESFSMLSAFRMLLVAAGAATRPAGHRDPADEDIRMRRNKRWLGAAVVGGCTAVIAGCAAPAVATPEQRELHEQRLLAPFLQPREVGCGELLVELTGNFHRNVGQPAVDKERHRVSREDGDGYIDTVWTNLAGTTQGAFVVTIGQPPELTERGLVPGASTRFRVVNQLRLRIYQDRRALTLNALAGGSFVLVKEASAAPREQARFEVRDGELRQQP